MRFGADTRVNLSTVNRERRRFNTVIVTLSGAADKTYSLTFPALSSLAPVKEIQENALRDTEHYTEQEPVLNPQGASDNEPEHKSRRARWKETFVEGYQPAFEVAWRSV